MPPSGKMPVSTAALRTSSTTAPMSTRASRLAEYSMVKCGMSFTPAFPVVASGEVIAHRAVCAIVGLNRVAFTRLNRTNEGSRQHHLTGLQRKPIRRDLVGEPCYTGCGLVEHAGGKAGFLDLAVAKT